MELVFSLVFSFSLAYFVLFYLLLFYWVIDCLVMASYDVSALPLQCHLFSWRVVSRVALFSF